MATLVRKKAKPKQRPLQELPEHPLVASGAPYRGNGGTSSGTQDGSMAQQTSPVKIHVSSDDLLLMEDFNDSGPSPVTPSAPDIDILRDSKRNEQLDHWEAIMMGSPMTPSMTVLPSQMRHLDGFSLTGENPPPSSTERTHATTAPVTTLLNGESPDSSPVLATQTARPVEKKYTLPPASVTMSSVADLLVPSKASRMHLTAPVYPVLAQLKPIVLPQSNRITQAPPIPAQYIEAPLVPLQELPRVPLQRFEHYDDHVHLRDDSLRHFEERLRTIETTPDDFYRLVEAYLHFEHALRQAHVQLVQRVADVDERRANVWTIDFDTASTTALCGDLKSIEESVEYQTASMNHDLQVALATQLTHLRQQRTAEAALHLYDRALSYLRIEQAVDQVIDGGDVAAIQALMDTLFFFEKNLTQPRFVGTVPTSVRRGQLVMDKNHSKSLLCHACGNLTALEGSARVVACARCDALCFVPQTTIALSSKEFQGAIAQVRRSVQHWLTRSMAKLHSNSASRSKEVVPWLLTHLLHMPGLAVERQWAVSFLQFPDRDTWDEVTLDHFLAMTHLLFHPSVLPMQYADNSTENADTPPDEWLLIEPPSQGELSVLDADYVLLWRQFPLETALAHCTGLPHHAAYSRLLYLVNECTVVFEKFADYDGLVTAVSESLGAILQTAAVASRGSLFDQLFQIGLFGVVMARSHKVYSSLPSWCYYALSPGGKWDALSAFFFQPYLPPTLKTYVQFQCFLAENPTLRTRLYHEVSRNDALLQAVGVLASHTEWSELVQTIVHEIFLCFMATHEALFEAHVRVLTVVCTAHPTAMSQLLALVGQHDAAIALFPRLPIQLWHPSAADLNVFQAWLMLDNLSDKKSALVRTILENLNWDYHSGEAVLALHPTVHRQVALMLVDATMHHASQATWGSRLVAVDFSSWSWTVMLKLHFYSTATYQPYLKLIHLESDLTKDAMILRRYTTSLPKSHIVLGKAEYTLDLKSCIAFVDASTSATALSTGVHLHDPEGDDTSADDPVVPLHQMEPIVLYAVCQLTDHLYSTCIDKFAPLLSLLLDHKRPVAVLQVLENILPTLSQAVLTQDDVHKFIKNYMEHNLDWRSVVKLLHKNLYFVPDADKSALVQQCLADRDGSMPLNQVLPVVVSTLEQSLCFHPAVLPALLDQLPSTSWMQSAVSTFVGLKTAVLKQPQTYLPDLVRLIQRQYMQTNHNSNVLLFWLVVLLGIPKWSDASVYRELVDTLIECAMVHRPDTMPEIETPFRLYLDHMCTTFPTSSLSFVSATYSTYTSFVFGDAKPKEMYLAFLSLVIEVRKEKELFKALGHIVLKSKLKLKSLDTLRAKGRLATELYVFGIDTSQPTLYGHVDLQFQQWTGLKLFKVASFLVLSDHPVDLLLWQLFFALYFASVGSECFGYMMLDLEPKTRKALQTKCRTLSNAYSSKVMHQTSTINPVVGDLARIYAGMDTWLENPDVASWLTQLNHLPSHYNTDYLKQILGLSKVLLHTSDAIDMHTKTIWEDIAPFLWLHLCDFSKPADVEQSVPSPSKPTENASTGSVPPIARLPFHAPKYFRFSPVVKEDNIRSLQLSVEPFCDRAMVYTDVLAQLVTLETEFLDHLSGLYQPKHRVIHTSRPCDGNGPNQPCKRPSALHLEYTEWTVDTNRQERLDQFRVQCAKFDLWTSLPVQAMMERPLYLQLTSLDAQVCYQILLMDQMVHQLTAASEQYKEVGVKWFHALVQLDSKQTRRFPPFQEVLWRSIKSLGMAFIKVDADETSGLLRFMLQDAARVCLLADCFFPNQTPTRFVEYFANIMYETEHLEPTDRLQLLDRFDIALWLDHDPILFDRDTLLSIILAELVLNNRNIEHGILRMHAKMIHVLATHYLDDHIDKILCALLGIYEVHYASDLHVMRAYFEPAVAASTPQALDVSMWQALLNIPPSCWSNCAVVPQLVERMAQFVLHARIKAQAVSSGKPKDTSALVAQTIDAMYPILLWHSPNAILRPMCDLMLLWLKAQTTADSLWLAATKLFQAFLTVLYTPGSTADGTTIVGPWPPTELAADQIVCNALQAALTMYLEHSPPCDRERLDNIWQFYRGVLLPHASDAVAGSYYDVLSRLPWTNWAITEVTLNEMKECVTSHTHVVHKSSVSFKYQPSIRANVLLVVRDVLDQVPWHRITDEYLATQPPHVTSSFYIKYHVLLCHVLLLEQSPQQLSTTFKQCQPHPRSIKAAEVEAICNGMSALVLHPSILCVAPRNDATPRFYAAFRLVLSLCGLELTAVAGDELKKASVVLHCLSVFLHPASPEWKQNFSMFESTLLGLVQASLHAVYDLLTLLHAQLDTLHATFKSDHILALYCDIFKLCNLPFISQAASTPLDVCSWMELEAKVTVVIPPSSQECTMLSLEKCTMWSAAGWQLVWQFAGLSKSVAAICTSVASVSVLTQLTEHNLDTWKMSTWPDLKLPELSQDELVHMALKQQCWLTLLAFAKQHRIDENGDVQRHLQYSMRMNEWVEEIATAPAIADEAKLVGVVIALLKRLVAMPGVAVTFKRDMVARMSKACWSMGDARQLSNGLDAVQRAIGFTFMNSFGKLKHSPDLHVAMLALSLFMRVNSRKSAALRLDFGMPLEVSRKTWKLIKTMESMTERKEVVQWSLGFCQDPKRSLRDLDEYVSVLFTELYPAHAWLLEMVNA
ncbi:hypothetical protein H310_07736 [Aphanomyces invadans]|uniref:Uncharacterized protein n=2 Tax=Aphanomyces invadans TaxID=157072 RepID=A0A024U0B5_9STRA|nr:hypothetical protein H310_07736 [Aphanomyces invadans]ETV99669.1 hypothetical protein H310_07736 [Aphanomyces invadans]|eukprot:XP_008871445.1 hypothetical protein H310_07736 [Aphanomyces invadans]